MYRLVHIRFRMGSESDDVASIDSAEDHDHAISLISPRNNVNATDWLRLK